MSAHWPWRQPEYQKNGISSSTVRNRSNFSGHGIEILNEKIVETQAQSSDSPASHPLPTNTASSEYSLDGPSSVTSPNNPRIFNPNFCSCWPGDVSPATLIRYNPNYSVYNLLYSTHIFPERLQAKESSIAMFIDGNAKDLGTPKAKASYGVYFGPGSKFNCKGLIPGTWKPTLQLADLAATITALKTVKDKCMNNLAFAVYLNHVIIATDADYIVQAMTEMIKAWRVNGFKNSLGGEVANKDILQELNGYIEELENQGIEVAFWKISRYNSGFKMAEKLSTEAFQ